MTHWRVHVLSVVLGLVPLVGLGQVRTYEQVGGHFHLETLVEHKKGQYLPVRPVGKKDTLMMWLEGTTNERAPDRAAAAAADVVVWCHSDQYPDPRHPLPQAGRIYVVHEWDDGAWWLHIIAGGTFAALDASLPDAVDLSRGAGAEQRE